LWALALISRKNACRALLEVGPTGPRPDKQASLSRTKKDITDIRNPIEFDNAFNGWGMESQQPAQNSRHTRLDSWKFIARYLGRSSRTVQRWHSNYGLPVRHLSGGESGSVYAFTDDLDRWLRERGQDTSSEIQDRLFRESLPSELVDHQAYEHGSLSKYPLICERSQSRSSRLVALALTMWRTVTDRNLPAIIHHFREAIDLNPENAEAYAGLSLGFIYQGICGSAYPPRLYAAGGAALERSLILDHSQPLAKCANAWLDLLLRRDWGHAASAFDEILKVSPACTHSLNGRALLCIAEGRLSQASAYFLKAAQEIPLSPVPMTLNSWCSYLAGDHLLALDQVAELRATENPDPILNAVTALSATQNLDDRATLDRLEELATEFPMHDVLRGALGFAQAKRGNTSKAREILYQLTDRGMESSHREPYAIALIFLGLNEPQKAAGLLEHSCRNGSLWGLGMSKDPILKTLRNDPAYRRLFADLAHPGKKAPGFVG
jgi:tetratricopeptide (TPR) repeat protein